MHEKRKGGQAMWLWNKYLGWNQTGDERELSRMSDKTRLERTTGSGGEHRV